jgi:hypothetical protein
MSDATHPWDQREGEPNIWYDRFFKYCQLGSKRSLAAIYRKERRVQARRVAYQKKSSRNSGISKSWHDASKRWEWESRAVAWDADQRAQLSAEYERRKAEILSSGMALNFERLERLGKLSDLLWRELNTPDKRWLPDVKSIGQGENAERVDLVRFNSGLIQQFRETLDDIAAEMGERVRGLKLSGNMSVTAVNSDDMNQAKLKADEWRKKTFGGASNPPAPTVVEVKPDNAT